MNDEEKKEYSLLKLDEKVLGEILFFAGVMNVVATTFIIGILIFLIYK